MAGSCFFPDAEEDPRKVRAEAYRRFNDPFFVDGAVRDAVQWALAMHLSKGNQVAYLHQGEVRVSMVPDPNGR